MNTLSHPRSPFFYSLFPINLFITIIYDSRTLSQYFLADHYYCLLAQDGSSTTRNLKPDQRIRPRPQPQKSYSTIFDNGTPINYHLCGRPPTIIQNDSQDGSKIRSSPVSSWVYSTLIRPAAERREGRRPRGQQAEISSPCGPGRERA